MKKLLILSVLGAFCLSVASCTMSEKKDKKGDKPSHRHHRRYHSELSVDN